MKYLIFLCGIVVGGMIYHFFIFPKIVDYRAEKFGLLKYQYVSTQKHPEKIYKEGYEWELYYIKYGTTTDRSGIWKLF